MVLVERFQISVAKLKNIHQRMFHIHISKSALFFLFVSKLQEILQVMAYFFLVKDIFFFLFSFLIKKVCCSRKGQFSKQVCKEMNVNELE